MPINLSQDQRDALKQLLYWYRNPNTENYVTLGGYAGTGKTTVISIFRKIVHEKINPDLKVAFCSYTGRAARILETTLHKTQACYPKDSIGTIHSLIYSPIENKKGVIIGWQRKEKVTEDLIIVDEASMIDHDIWSDLKTYKKPIIAVGDHGQLPPINGKFNLMENPQVKLEKIHRQNENNPIIDIATQARTKGQVKTKRYSECVLKLGNDNYDSQEIITELLQNYETNTIVLCGYNSTRNKLNNFIRTSLGFELPTPQPGDRVICLRNNHTEGIFNGMLGTVTSIAHESEDWYYAEIEMDDKPTLYKGLIYAHQFGMPQAINFTKDRAKALAGDLFDFGYALTVHKAQGSQAKRVILFEERSQHMDDEMWRRWLYTGITRAEEELIVVGN